MATPTNLPAAQTTGNVLTAAYVNDLRGAFRVLQVVQASTSTETTNNTNTFADTGLTATITPQATSSKILVIVNHVSCRKLAGNAGSGLNLRLFRGATNIKTLAAVMGFTNASSDLIFSQSASVLDSPATVSATTYKTQFANNENASGVRVQAQSVESQITLMEISA
jgi:hypothetical protein